MVTCSDSRARSRSWAARSAPRRSRSSAVVRAARAEVLARGLVGGGAGRLRPGPRPGPPAPPRRRWPAPAAARGSGPASSITCKVSAAGPVSQLGGRLRRAPPPGPPASARGPRPPAATSAHSSPAPGRPEAGAGGGQALGHRVAAGAGEVARHAARAPPPARTGRRRWRSRPATSSPAASSRARPPGPAPGAARPARRPRPGRPSTAPGRAGAPRASRPPDARLGQHRGEGGGADHRRQQELGVANRDQPGRGRPARRPAPAGRRAARWKAP